MEAARVRILYAESVKVRVLIFWAMGFRCICRTNWILFFILTYNVSKQINIYIKVTENKF